MRWFFRINEGTRVSGALGATLVARPALQPFDDLGYPLVVHAIDQIQVNTGVGEGPAKSNDQRELLRREVVAVFGKCGRQVVPSLISKQCIRHRLLGEPLQHINTNRPVLGRTHLCITLAWRCYCLTDRDCTSPATDFALAHRGGASMTKRTK